MLEYDPNKVKGLFSLSSSKLCINCSGTPVLTYYAISCFFGEMQTKNINLKMSFLVTKNCFKDNIRHSILSIIKALCLKIVLRIFHMYSIAFCYNSVAKLNMKLILHRPSPLYFMVQNGFASPVIVKEGYFHVGIPKWTE